MVIQGFPNNQLGHDAAGNALKSCRQVNSPLGGDCNATVHPRWDSHWLHYGFDEFGFSAFPGGCRSAYGFFNFLGNEGFWWASTEYWSTYAWLWNMICYDGNFFSYHSYMAGGISVRCLRD